VPIIRTAAGRLCIQLGDSASLDGVRDTLLQAFDASPGPQTRGAEADDAWQELSIGGHRFTVEWNRWKGCRVISEEPSGNGTLRQIAVWFQEDREVW
jgi:hypothetical protein